MDLIEVSIGPDRIVAFDGRVLEIFGVSEYRFHARLLSVAVFRPDKRGNRRIVLEHPRLSHALTVDEPTWECLQPLLEALKSAGVPVTD